MTLLDLLALTWPVRWLHSALRLVRGVRLHPSAVLRTRGGRVVLGRGSAIGARGRIQISGRGELVFGDGVWLASDVEIQTGSGIRIGSGTTIQKRSTLIGSIRLGRDCIFAPNIFVSSRTHPFRVIPHLPIREQERRVAKDPALKADADRPVWIQDDCWLGANVVVAPGVTIGKGSVVGANSVVTKDVLPYSVVAGAPARLLRRRLEWLPPALVRIERPEDRIYVLSGAPILDEGGNSVAVGPTADESVEVVIARTAQVRIFLSVTGPIRITVGNRIRELLPGTSEMTVGESELSAFAEFSLISIAVVSGSTGNGLAITRIEAT